MADQPPPAAISSVYPAPPPFYKSFTAENLAAQKTYLETINQPASGPLPTPASGLDLLSLPPELRNLFPPAPPPDGKYRSFGVEYDVSAANSSCLVNNLSLTKRTLRSPPQHLQNPKPVPHQRVYKP